MKRKIVSSHEISSLYGTPVFVHQTFSNKGIISCRNLHNKPNTQEIKKGMFSTHKGWNKKRFLIIWKYQPIVLFPSLLIVYPNRFFWHWPPNTLISQVAGEVLGQLTAKISSYYSIQLMYRFLTTIFEVILELE